MHGYHLHKLLSDAVGGHRDVRIDVLTVGAPMFADQNFMDATAKRLNQRNIVYVGDGAGGSFDEVRGWVGGPLSCVCVFVFVCVCVHVYQKQGGRIASLLAFCFFFFFSPPSLFPFPPP
jgi:hypothetical protein